jgi:activator of HSP90 ATPase
MPNTILQTIKLPAPFEDLYDTYLDPERHAAMTGCPVTIAPKPLAEFSAFEGAIMGRILHLTPKRQIVQTWRSSHWTDDDLNSTLILSFWPDPEGARVELAHVNVADHDYESVKEGWDKYYWTPWRASLEIA